MSKHTPTPWIKTGTHPISITNAESREIAYVPVCMTDCDEPQAFADADLILKAVNHHDELVAVLEAIEFYEDSEPSADTREYEIMVMRRSVLAKLKGETK
jgi:hypothetical protein